MREQLDAEGVPRNELQALVDSRVVLHAPALAESGLSAAIAATEKNWCQPLRGLALDGKCDGVSPCFVHPTGNKSEVTTRLSTSDRYGAIYHLCVQMTEKERLLTRLLSFAARERALHASPDGFAEAALALPEDLKQAREMDFFTWNACVSEELALGDGGLTEESLGHYLEQERETLPTLFTSPGDPQEDDIAFFPELLPRLGKFEITAGEGKHLHLDRELVRETLDRLTGTESRESYIVHQISAFGPWALLQGGKELVDAPGSADKSPLHRSHLVKSCVEADHIIVVSSKTLRASAGDMLGILGEHGVLQRFFEPNNVKPVKLSVVFNQEMNCKGLTAFHARRNADVTAFITDAVSQIAMAIQKHTKTPLKLPEIKHIVKERVEMFAIFPIIFAGLKLFPDDAALLDELDDIVSQTNGSKLLGLIEAGNLLRVSEVVEGFRDGALANALAAIDARITHLSDPPTGQALRAAAAALLHPRRGSRFAARKEELREFFINSFQNPQDEDAPYSVLKDGLDEAFDEFCSAVDEHFEGVSFPSALAAWKRMKPKFTGNAELALAAHTALVTNDSGPWGMDLSAPCTRVSLPSDAVQALQAGLYDAVDGCRTACLSQLNEQLIAVSGTGDEQQSALARRLIEQSFAVEGEGVLRQSLSKVTQCLTARRLTKALSRAKSEALKLHIASKTPTPAADDAAGVVTLVNNQLNQVLKETSRLFKKSVQRMLKDVLLLAMERLRPVATKDRRKHSRFLPGMEEYMNSALAFLSRSTDAAAMDDQRQEMVRLRVRGQAAATAATAVVDDLKALLRDTAALGAAAEQYVTRHITFRDAAAQQQQQQQPAPLLELMPPVADHSQGPAPPPPPQRPALRSALKTVVNDLNKLPYAPPFLRLNIKAHGTGPAALAAFSALLATQADGAGAAILRASLAALPVPLVDVRVKDDSLWVALAQQFFRRPSRANPQAVKEAVLVLIRRTYTSAAREVQLRAVTGDPLITSRSYVREQCDGSRRAGLLEVVFAAHLYKVCVRVWVAGAAQPLLVYDSPSGVPTDALSFNIVLADGASRFRGVKQLDAEGGGDGGA